MADKTGIEWTDATWNPIVGCSIVSPGCTNCYAMRQAQRIERMREAEAHEGDGYEDHYAGTTKIVNGKPVWTGKVALAPDHIITAPLRWRRPRRIFVNSMGDLFHESVPDEWIDRIFAVMALAPQHTFQVLTKRSKRMREYCSTIQKDGRWLNMEDIARQMGRDPRGADNDGFDFIAHKQFLPNVWLGVSAEDQARADERIPDLLATPAAVRWVSAEPLLGSLRIHNYLDIRGTIIRLRPEVRASAITRGLDWIVAGSESGPGARPCDVEWVRSIKEQCTAAAVPFFWKQHVINGRKIATPELDGKPWIEYPHTGHLRSVS